MFSTFITVALFVSLAIQGASANFAISTPTLDQCTPAKISWSPGTKPYSIEVVSDDDPCGPALLTIDNLSSTVYNYTTTLKPGTSVLLFIADSAGQEAWSGKITIGGSSDTTCTPDASTITVSSESAPAVNTEASSTLDSTTPTPASPSPSGIGGALNAGSTSGGVFTVHRASTPLLSITALVAMLALTLY